MQVQLRAGIVGSSIQKDIPLEFSGCSLDLDINTSQDRKDVLPSDRLSAIWHELAFLGTEIATDGDAC